MLSDPGDSPSTVKGNPVDARAQPPRARPAAPVQTLQAINGLRGPGALAIALAHFGIATDAISVRHLEPIALLVDLFFVLSGLVIAQAYSEKLARPSAIPEYVVRRVGRIWPVQVATIAVLVLYELAKLALHATFGKHFSSPPFDPDGINLIQAIPTNLLLVQSLGFHDRETWNFPSWSLSVELVTYVLFAGFCLVRPHLRRVLMLLTIVISITVLIFIAPYHMRSTFDYGIFRCLAGFFAGTLCCEIIARRRVPTFAMPTLVEGTAVAMVCVWLAFAMGTYASFAAPFIFGAFVLAFAGGRGRVSRLLMNKPLRILAEWSFAIYMVHAVVLIFFLAAVHQLGRWSDHEFFTFIRNPIADHPGARPMIEVLHLSSVPSIVLVALVYGVGVLVAAWLAYAFVEVPGRALFARLARRFDPRTSKSAVPATRTRIGSMP